jgi:hypothetical protein
VKHFTKTWHVVGVALSAIALVTRCEPAAPIRGTITVNWADHVDHDFAVLRGLGARSCAGSTTTQPLVNAVCVADGKDKMTAADAAIANAGRGCLTRATARRFTTAPLAKTSNAPAQWL